MGFGDSLINSGLARGLAARGKLAAFGDGDRIRWSASDFELFKGNPNVAWPGQDHSGYKLEWIHSYVGKRPYAEMSNGRWRFIDFQCPPGEVFLTPEEKAWAMARIWPIISDPVAVLEPRVKGRPGACDGRNKQWPVARYESLAAELQSAGMRIIQFVPTGKRPLLKRAESIETPTFRHALSLLGLISLYVGPEGGLHHGSAAMGTPAVVIFGGFNTPKSTGYPQHINLTVGEPCGTHAHCRHCTTAMDAISVDTVLAAAKQQLGQKVAA